MYSLVFNYLNGFKTLTIIHIFVICIIAPMKYHNIYWVLLFIMKNCVYQYDKLPSW